MFQHYSWKMGALFLNNAGAEGSLQKNYLDLIHIPYFYIAAAKQKRNTFNSIKFNNKRFNCYVQNSNLIKFIQHLVVLSFHVLRISALSSRTTLAQASRPRVSLFWVRLLRTTTTFTPAKHRESDKKVPAKQHKLCHFFRKCVQKLKICLCLSIILIHC